MNEWIDRFMNEYWNTVHIYGGIFSNVGEIWGKIVNVWNRFDDELLGILIYWLISLFIGDPEKMK